MRQTHEYLASGGNEKSAAELEGPEYPDAARYLHEWAEQLHLRRRTGMNGWERVGYGEIADWSTLTGTALHPCEVAALAHLTDAMAWPSKPEEESDG